MSVFQRYLLVQCPGWALAAVVLYGLHRWLGLPLWLAAVLMAADIIKDFVLFPYLRRAYETDGGAVMDRLIGRSAIVRQALDPEGYVQVGGELWRARQSSPSAPVEPGQRVAVVGADGMVLRVAPSSAEDAS